MSVIILFDQLPEALRQAIITGATRTLCPKCEGGRSREQSLSIRPDGDVTIKLACWRSTCDWYAYTLVDPKATMTTRKLTTATIYREPTMPVQGVTLQRLRVDYQLDDSTWQGHGWRQQEGTETLVLPVKCPNSGTRGHITRTMIGPKKVRTFKATAQPWLDHWPCDGSSVVVVEDVLSACRLSGLGYYAVALLGTSITVEQAQEIRDIAHERAVYLALDQDATAKAMKLARRHAHIVTFLPVCLTEDIKNIAETHHIHRLFIGGQHG